PAVDELRLERGCVGARRQERFELPRCGRQPGGGSSGAEVDLVNLRLALGPVGCVFEEPGPRFLARVLVDRILRGACTDLVRGSDQDRARGGGTLPHAIETAESLAKRIERS